MSDSLQPHESQHARPPCPSQLPEFTQTHVHQVSDAIQPSSYYPNLINGIFLGSKITADGDCHEIKRRLLLGRKVMTNLDGIFKSRDITLPTKVRLVKAMVFPVVMYGCDSGTVKKAEHWRIDAFVRPSSGPHLDDCLVLDAPKLSPDFWPLETLR